MQQARCLVGLCDVLPSGGRCLRSTMQSKAITLLVVRFPVDCRSPNTYRTACRLPLCVDVGRGVHCNRCTTEMSLFSFMSNDRAYIADPNTSARVVTMLLLMLCIRVFPVPCQLGRLGWIASKLATKQTVRLASRELDRVGGLSGLACLAGGAALWSAVHPIEATKTGIQVAGNTGKLVYEQAMWMGDLFATIGEEMFAGSE